MSTVLSRGAEPQSPADDRRKLILRRVMVLAAQHAELEAAVSLAQAASDSLKQRLDDLLALVSDEPKDAQEGRCNG